jgi:hypothetical protein
MPRVLAQFWRSAGIILGFVVHAAGGIKGITNFDLTEYERDVGWLTAIAR